MYGKKLSCFSTFAARDFNYTDEKINKYYLCSFTVLSLMPFQRGFFFAVVYEDIVLAWMVRRVSGISFFIYS